MKCKQYIFQLTSGQLADAPLGVNLEARLHRLQCRHCRAFTHNDQALQRVMNTYREHTQRADESKQDRVD